MIDLLLAYRRPFIFFIESLLVILSFFLAFISRFDAGFAYSEPRYFQIFIATLPAVILLRLLSYWYFDLFKGLWRYVSVKDLTNIIKASFAGTVLFTLYVYVIANERDLPRSIPLIDFAYNILLFSGIRMAVRLYRERGATLHTGLEVKDGQNVIIVGAGDAGEMIVREMMKNPRLGYHPVGFVDDDRRKHKKTIHGYPVLGKTEDVAALVKEYGVNEILIAIPSATGKEIGRIVEFCKRADVRFKTLPYVSDLIGGRVDIAQIREVDIEDLLGRESVDLDLALIGSELRGRVLMITGAAGSIGSELVRQTARFAPDKIILFERAENDLFHLQNELSKGKWNTSFISIVGDVRDGDSVSACMKKYRPNHVFHAAAYKHVPMMELNPVAAVKNNIQGTRVMADMAVRFGVEKFVLISTDKAVRPTNIMGTTKRVAEMIIQAKNQSDESRTSFIAVRFGNVLGSNGSVIPHFKKQIAEGGPVTVTHPEITRYFMTIPEAVQLVIQAGAMGKGMELFLLDMGEPVKITHLAENLIRLSGMVPGKDVEIVYTGLRPGEKMYEELLIEGENVKETRHEKIKVIEGEHVDTELLSSLLDKLENAAKEGNIPEIKSLLKAAVPEYQQIYSDATPPIDTIEYPVKIETVTIH